MCSIKTQEGEKKLLNTWVLEKLRESLKPSHITALSLRKETQCSPWEVSLSADMAYKWSLRTNDQKEKYFKAESVFKQKAIYIHTHKSINTVKATREVKNTLQDKLYLARHRRKFTPLFSKEKGQARATWKEGLQDNF